MSASVDGVIPRLVVIRNGYDFVFSAGIEINLVNKVFFHVIYVIFGIFREMVGCQRHGPARLSSLQNQEQIVLRRFFLKGSCRFFNLIREGRALMAPCFIRCPEAASMKAARWAGVFCWRQFG